MSKPKRSLRISAAKLVHGMGLVELMIAMAIGLVLIAGAGKVFVSSRKTYVDNESIARLEESARYAMNVLEPDIRMAGYWGLTKAPNLVAKPIAQTDPAFLGGAMNDCGNNYFVDITMPIQGSNNQYGFGTAITGVCTAKYAAMGSADTVTVRRTSNVSLAATVAGTITVCSNRANGPTVISGTASTCTGAGTAGTRLSNLIVDGYYVDSNSDQTQTLPVAQQMPSLRRKILLQGTPTISDQEIMPGVEDMQVQYGVEIPGVNQPKAIAAFYVNGDQLAVKMAANPSAQVTSVRVWLLVRSDATEIGFVDNRIYQYADRLLANGGPVFDLTVAGSAGRAFQPSLAGTSSPTSIAHYRRILMSRTFQLRNALGT